MTKKVTSVTLDEDIAEQVSNDDSLNLSGTVNNLLREYLYGNTDADSIAMLELREEQLTSDINSLEGDLENKREELSRVQDRLADARDSKQNHREDVLEDAGRAMDKIPQSQLTEDNPAVENWARKAGLDEAELLDWYQTEQLDGGDSE